MNSNDRRIVAALPAAVLGLITLVGCTSIATLDASPGREVSLAEFSDAGGGVREPRSPLADLLRPADSDTTASSGVGADPQSPWSAGVDEPGSVAGLSSSSSSSPRLIVDRMIGQVNGRPVYAQAFFADIDDQLRAKAGELPDAAFMKQAEVIITRRLYQVVLNELILAEAEASLTTQQQQGLFSLIGRLREQEIAKNRGSELEARRKIAEEDDMTLGEFVNETKEQILIRELIQRNVLPRVIVSWRDIENEYESRYDEFNPPPRLVIARLQLSTRRNADQIPDVTARLQNGESFQSVAEDLDQWDDDHVEAFELGPGGIDEIELNETAREKLKTIGVGQTTEAFQLGSSVLWLHIVAHEQDAGKSLYDVEVQRMLVNDIWGRRQAEEQDRYFESLLQKGIFDELDNMVVRLMEIAAERYLK